MLLRGVRPHHVDDDLEVERMGARDQRVEIGQAAERWIDVAIVCDVVAEIRHGRDVERRNPDTVDAERRDVIELLDDARQIADAIAVAILKAPGIDLINDGVSPPGIAHADMVTTASRRVKKEKIYSTSDHWKNVFKRRIDGMPRSCLATMSENGERRGSYRVILKLLNSLMTQPATE